MGVLGSCLQAVEDIEGGGLSGRQETELGLWFSVQAEARCHGDYMPLPQAADVTQWDVATSQPRPGSHGAFGNEFFPFPSSAILRR